MWILVFVRCLDRISFASQGPLRSHPQYPVIKVPGVWCPCAPSNDASGYISSMRKPIQQLFYNFFSQFAANGILIRKCASTRAKQHAILKSDVLHAYDQCCSDAIRTLPRRRNGDVVRADDKNTRREGDASMSAFREGTQSACANTSPLHEATPSYAFSVLATLEAAGAESWIVGGFVRDALMGRAATDVDIATVAPWQEVRAVCKAAGFATHQTGVKHGTLTVVPDGAHAVEVTTYRADGAYTDGRHPDHVAFLNSIEEDLQRRDFTMNAMAWHPARGLLDPFGGQRDITAGIIRVVGDPERRFTEDALRILRACRFASQLGFSIDDATFTGMVRNKFRLAQVSTERVTHELDALVMGEWVHDALMRCVDVLAFVLPELAAMKDCDQITKWHIYDVLEHTAYTVQHAPAERLVRWAALAHDMGKPAAAFFDADGVEHFYGHAAVGARMARGMCERLLMSPTFRTDVELLVRRHDDVIEPTARGVRRALMRLDGRVELFRALLALKRADTLAHSAEGAKRATLIDQLEEVLEQVLGDDAAFSVRDLRVDGCDVLSLGVPEGPEVGRRLQAALDAVVDERIPNEREALICFLKSLDATPCNP